MENFFCAEESRQLQEDVIGCALNRRYYILVELPPPWTPHPLDSKSLSHKFQALKAQINLEIELSIRLVFIYNSGYYEAGYNRLIIYFQRQESDLFYTKKEFLLSDIENAIPIVEKCIRGEPITSEYPNIPARDILICTHGSHDKCCAKYGNPFYHQALKTLEGLSIPNVRIWQSSHFGGHRFAPTMIDLPEARYYGRLDQKSFTNILTKTGDIQVFKNVYRGWGVLPWQVQILERELILKYDWEWFSYQVKGQVIQKNEDETSSIVEISLEISNGIVETYRCNIIEDESKNIFSRGECSNREIEKVLQFKINELVGVKSRIF
ncbi:sucrase ferredoxin [Calothrix sp. PCC 6303]|uniref:sucrase ferredoxin n=1 Tax=Calothrix sp. PCC 6303 TaxID=1170562 RepID=UPI0005A2ACBF|nr:sucrase ferredoxin [Calothrix sp. PCC 6303]